MRKHSLILILMTCFLFGASFPLNAQGVLLKKDIYVGATETQDNVITFGGEIIIEESVIAFGGSIVISGEVDNSVIGIGANITLHPSAIVRGDLVSIGGTLNRDPQAKIEGDTIFFETTEELWNSIKTALGGLFGLTLLPIILLIKVISLFVWLIIALLIALLFPRHVVNSSLEIRKNFWSVFGLGLLSIIIFAGLIILAAFLSIIIIGIPLLITLIFIGLAIKMFSRVVIYAFFGEVLTRAFGSKNPALILQVVLGFVFVSIVTFIPILGTLVALAFNIIGWGAVIKTRFGTRHLGD
jgi:hypothetical protein